MNQTSLSLVPHSHNRSTASSVPFPCGRTVESLLVVRIPLLGNDEAASRIRSVIPGASIVGLFNPTEPRSTAKAEQAAISGRDALTGRQQDVLALLVEGLSNKEIGRRLDLSHFTVRNHVSSILRILDFRCRRDMRQALRDASPRACADVIGLR